MQRVIRFAVRFVTGSDADNAFGGDRSDAYR